jgi:hypothetical protein
MSVVAEAPAVRSSLRGPAVLISLASLVALAFFAVAAAPYLLSSEYNAAQYMGRRPALLVHITFGTIALFSGPVQLWLGLAERTMTLHRKLGIVYMIGVTGSAAAAYVIALQPSAGWIFGTGLMGLATAWLVTTTLAFLAIRRQLIDQHKEWMIRSYVVTFAFVTFRALATVLEGQGVATLDRIGVAAWFCWAVPLLVNEVVLQGRKILRVRAD